MNLLRFRPVERTERLMLPDGSTRLVKVTINDANSVQHIEDGDHVHGTARPPAVRLQISQPSTQRKGMLLRNLGMPKMRQAFTRGEYDGIWAPVPGTEELR